MIPAEDSGQLDLRVLLADIRYAMLTTIASDGNLVSRPYKFFK
jgi:hypothetical protein